MTNSYEDLLEKKDAAKGVLVDIYKTVWHAADAAGREGGRTRDAIDAVMLTIAHAIETVMPDNNSIVVDVFEVIANQKVRTTEDGSVTEIFVVTKEA